MRHPIYAGYLVTHVGVPRRASQRCGTSSWSSIADTALVVRALIEERVLVADARLPGVLPPRRLALVPGVF